MSAKPIVIPPGAGELLGNRPDRRVEILSDRDELHVTWSRFGPGRDGAGRHIHFDHHDFFYVLEGELTVKTDDDGEMAAPAATLASIPPLVVHGFRNAADVEVKFLNLHAPGCGFMNYMRGLRDGITVDFDQHDPEGVEGIRPSSEISIGLPFESDELSIFEACVEPDEVLGQLHPDHVVSFYVLQGELALELEEGVVRAPAGVWVQFEPGTAFTPSAAGGEPTRYLRLHSLSSG